jgi:LysR family nitrogen assimilation transcriptional regulator
MRFRQLECFIRACETGSITRAAADLNIAQPALGLQIRSLEHEFDATLIVRSSRGVAPTPQGELVLSWARKMVAETTDLRRQLSLLKAGSANASITLGMTASLTSMIASSVVEAAARELPQLSLKIVEGYSQYLAEWVDDERIDFGFGFGAYDTRSVQMTPLMRERLFYISAPGAPSTPIALSDVLQLTLAVPDEQNSIRQVVEEAARSIDLPVIGSYEIGSLQAARDIARRGIAGAIVPFGGVADDLRSAELSVRMIVSPPLVRTLYLMHKGARPVSSIEAALIRIVTNALQSAVRGFEDSGAYDMIDEPSANATD